jgi:nucleotide-binding universal stress UspA family protein
MLTKGGRNMIKKILVPVDGSGHASRAIEMAANLASQYDAVIHLIHVVTRTKIPDELIMFARTEGIHESPYFLALQTMGNQILEAARAEAQKKGAKNVEASVLEGDPAETIINYAKEKGFDMIVIGSRGLGNFQGLMLGSVSSKVCHAAEQTCVTVR